MPVSRRKARYAWSLTVPPALALVRCWGSCRLRRPTPFLAERATAEGPAFETLNQWSIVPSSGARWRGSPLDTRQDFKLSTVSTGRYGLYG